MYIALRKHALAYAVAAAVVSLLLVASFWYVGRAETQSSIVQPPEAPARLKISFVGDLLMHTAQRKSGYDPARNTYDFHYFFQGIKKYLQDQDFVIGSLETPIVKEATDAAYSGYPFFKNPPEFVAAIKEAGINVLVTANNHALDQGIEGAVETMTWLERYGLPYTGTFKNAEERAQQPVLFLEKRGIKLALLSYTESTNGRPASGGTVNLLNLDLVRQDIAFARDHQADLVIVWLHCGNEYQRQPEPQKRKMVEEVARLGADIIIGSHPHVLEPMEVLEVEGRKVFVAYSLGNFISNQYWRYSTDGVILNMEIEKTGGETKFTNITYLPTAVVRVYHGPEVAGEKAVKAMTDGDFITRAISRGILKGPEVKFKVVAVAEALRNYETGAAPDLTEKDYLRLKTTWEDTVGLLGEGEYFRVYRPETP